MCNLVYFGIALLGKAQSLPILQVISSELHFFRIFVTHTDRRSGSRYQGMITCSFRRTRGGYGRHKVTQRVPTVSPSHPTIQVRVGLCKGHVTTLKRDGTMNPMFNMYQCSPFLKAPEYGANKDSRCPYLWPSNSGKINCS